MKKKVRIIVSLTGPVHTVIQDEPNDGLDPVSNMKIKTLLRHYRDRGMTVIVSSHVLEWLDGFADTCTVLKNGVDGRKSPADFFLESAENEIALPEGFGGA